MKNLQRVILSGMLISVLTFGLAGCGSNKSNKSASSNKTKTEKVVKDSSSKKAKKAKQTTSSKSKNASNNSASNSNNANSSVNTNQNDSSSSSTENTNQRQLGLGDVAVWTDANGVTHHVDSDGMDRQTISGSSQVNYSDWSGSLPSQAQIIRQN